MELNESICFMIATFFLKNRIVKLNAIKFLF